MIPLAALPRRDADADIDADLGGGAMPSSRPTVVHYAHLRTRGSL